MNEDVNSSWRNFKNQKQWERYIKHLIRSNYKAAIRALLIVYRNQTEEEKSKSKSIDHNNIGFSNNDDYELSNLAAKAKNNQFISIDEIKLIQKKMPKYWRQLMVYSKIKMKEEEIEISKCFESSDEAKNLSNPDVVNAKDCLSGKGCEYGICDECEGYEEFSQMRIEDYERDSNQ